MSSRAEQLQSLGQSVWLDFIRRGHLLSGAFDQLVATQGVVGVTSNPTIFQLAITEGDEYDAAIQKAVARGLSGPALFEALAIEDIQNACDRLAPVAERSGGLDGRVSIEVSPRLAHDTQGTIDEGLRLNRRVARSNVMVKIPATAAGLPAIRAAIAEGININVTLIFSLARYEQVMDAYMEGLEARLAKGLPIDSIYSVASFFVSRVDTKVDAAIDAAIAKLPAADPRRAELSARRGRAAIANARLAYARFRERFSAPRFEALRAKGAKLQRPLWASTSSKNPAYRDTIYVEELIGADTVNTMPLATLAAFNDHGVLESRIERDLDAARALFRELPALGIPIDDLIAQLEPEGVASFSKSYDTLLDALEAKRRNLHGKRWVSLEISPGEAGDAARARLDQLEQEGFSRRLWSRDVTLWSTDPAHHQVARTRLGWLSISEPMKQGVADLQAFAREVARDGYRHVVLLGMGGSSLAPEVFARVFGVANGALEVTVLDSTSPAAVRAIAEARDPKRTFFIVSSKSGNTLEVSSFERFFFEWVSAAGGPAGNSFAAITDPGTTLEQLAKTRGYRRTFVNASDIGGRYSALSYFGLVPAALLGVDLEALLEHALDEARISSPEAEESEHFGLELGAALGELARRGRDKVTLVLGSEFEAFGSWVEQLVAESTGKEGRGIVPITGEPLGSPEVYGNDRVFVSFSVKPLPRETQARLDALERAGHPVLRWRDLELATLGAEFLRWEIATVVASQVIGVDPFDEPNVTEAKLATREVLDRFLADGRFPGGTPLADSGGVSVEAPSAVADRIAPRLNGRPDAAAWAAALLTLAQPSDYVAILAYMKQTPERDRLLERLRVAARAASRLATTVGYGPRFLHSTGQLHKGGPNTGIFLQLLAEEGAELAIPGEKFGFATLIRAQALGDYQVLERRGRRVLRVHLGATPERFLEEIVEAISAARV